MRDYILGLRTLGKKELNLKLSVGDAVAVRYESNGGKWKVRKFVGICIGITRKGVNLRYILRNVINGCAVEFSFYAYSPMVLHIEQLPVQKYSKLRKSKLFILRKQPLKKSTIKFI